MGTGLVLVLYLALNMAYALALSAADIRAIVDGPEDVNAIAPVAQISADRLYGHGVADLVSIAIGLTLLASVSAYILTGPRVAHAMARPAVIGPVRDAATPRSSGHPITGRPPVEPAAPDAALSAAGRSPRQDPERQVHRAR